MRLTRSFGSTLREAPSGAEAASHQLLLRAGFIWQLGQGLFVELPLGRRSLTKVENIIRQEIDRIGGQEMTMPVVHPAEVWKTTGRWQTVGPELARFKDRRDRDMVLAMTHEEVVAALCVTEIRSHRQLPQLVYHIQTKFRDDPRPRAGLVRVREFRMKDSYSLDRDDAGLERQYRAHYQAYFNIFNRCGVPTIAVRSDVGMMGGSEAHEFMYLTPIGEDTLVLCDACGYAANRQVARFARPVAEGATARPLERVATPGAMSIDAVAGVLDVPKSAIAKTVVMVASRKVGDGVSEEVVFAIVRGDMEVNETKVSNAVNANWLRPATEAEIRAAGAEPGYASPVGLVGATVIVDDAIATATDLVAGANLVDHHLRHTSVPRDYAPSLIADIAAARDGDPCVDCGGPLRTARGVEAGNIFKLGTRYSEAVGATFLNEEGREQPIVMGSYGIGSGRLLACVAEEHHDARGLVWPVSVSPYHVHLVTLGKGADIVAAGDRQYEALSSARIEVLYDDRDERAGVKFADADLIGIPLRVTVSAKSLAQNSVELKDRSATESGIIGVSDLTERIKAELRAKEQAIAARVVPVPFR